MDTGPDGDEVADMARDRDRARDVELLGAWRSGDLEAGERLFDRHTHAVARFFENKVTQGAEDLIQATFLRILEGRDRVEHVVAFRPYLFGIARNVLREHLRELSRGRKTFAPGGVRPANPDELPR